MSRGIDHHKDLSLLTQTCRTPKGRPTKELRDTQVISDFDFRITKNTLSDTSILTILILIIDVFRGDLTDISAKIKSLDTMRCGHHASRSTSQLVPDRPDIQSALVFIVTPKLRTYGVQASEHEIIKCLAQLKAFPSVRQATVKWHRCDIKFAIESLDVLLLTCIEHRLDFTSFDPHRLLQILHDSPDSFVCAFLWCLWYFAR